MEDSEHRDGAGPPETASDLGRISAFAPRPLRTAAAPRRPLHLPLSAPLPSLAAAFEGCEKMQLSDLSYPRPRAPARR